MKVLSIAWTIYDERIKEFCKDCTGGGLVIKNICEYIGRKEESYLFIGRYQMPAIDIGNIHIVDTMSELEGVYDKRLEHIYKMLYIFENILNKIRPDIVNVHGIGEFSRLCIECCNRMKIPAVYTEHLFIGTSRTIEKYERVVEWEKSLYSIQGLNIIAVSTGMKKRIIEDFGKSIEKNIKVIKNGTDFEATIIPSDIKEQYNIQNKKVLLCVGTVLKRKNQEQLVRAFISMKSKIKEEISIIFCGNDGMNGELQNMIAQNGLSHSLIYVGGVSSQEMKKYYSIADGLVMPSLAEGLSIAALEAISYGLPIIMFRDSECADDLNDENVVCFAEKRSDQDLCQAIEKWKDGKWSTKYIKDYAKRFTMDRMTDDYLDYYECIINSSKEE